VTREDLMLNRIVGVAVVALLCAGAVAAGEKQAIRPPGAQPSGNWSHGILADGVLYVSGMAGEDASGKVPPNFEAEAKLALDNIDAVLKAAGMTSTNVVSVQVYLTDAALFQRMNKVYAAYFKDPRPARTTVIVARLVGDGHIEITVTARK
jgi:2-iminobutanoate/2-iminopropanoate deaminase